jgi:hypothetical protein
MELSASSGWAIQAENTTGACGQREHYVKCQRGAPTPHPPPPPPPPLLLLLLLLLLHVKFRGEVDDRWLAGAS